MVKKTTIVGHPINLRNLSFGFLSLFKRTCQIELSNAISELLNLKYVYFTNSGTSSFYTVLQILKEEQDKKEVILPAYTASSLIIAIQKAGLKPVLCDISLRDFNMDVHLLPDLVSKHTLCIVSAHMFGIVGKELRRLKERFPDIFIIEDCAQSLGSEINGTFVGNLADISVFSFNRGKNLPTYGGGCIATNSEKIANKIAVQNRKINGQSLSQRIVIPFKIVGLSLVVRPLIYGLCSPILSQFKEVAPPTDFEVKKYTDFQAAVALSLLNAIEKFSKKRYLNGVRLVEGLKNIEGIALPEISENTKPAFNRFPVVFNDLKKMERVEKELNRTGVDTSRMYLRPLHHIFNLGYNKKDFPIANHFAERLLTLPVHSLLTDIQLTKIVRTIKNA